MKFMIRMVCERTYEVERENYDAANGDTKAMLQMDIDAWKDDPESLVGMCIDDQDEEGVTFEVTGEVVEE